MLTAKRLRQLLEYNPQTGNFVWRIKKSSKVAGSFAGTIKANGYVQIGIDKRLYHAHRLAWLWMTGKWPKEVDHINGFPGDNRWVNLRLATRSQNMANAKRSRINETGFRGVYKTPKGRYVARISINNHNYHLGIFDTAEEAYAVFQAKYHATYGEFSRLKLEPKSDKVERIRALLKIIDI